MSQNHLDMLFTIYLMVYIFVASILLYVKPLMKYYKETKDKEITAEFKYNSRTIHNLWPIILVIIMPIFLMRTNILIGFFIALPYVPQLFIFLFNNRIKCYEHGFFIQKKFIYWDQLEGLEIVNEKKIKLKVLLYTDTDILISQIEEKKEFLKIITSKTNIKSDQVSLESGN